MARRPPAVLCQLRQDSAIGGAFAIVDCLDSLPLGVRTAPTRGATLNSKDWREVVAELQALEDPSAARAETEETAK